MFAVMCIVSICIISVFIAAVFGTKIYNAIYKIIQNFKDDGGKDNE